MSLASESLSGVATFVQVVEAGGFAAAAGRLGLTRSAVGKTIAKLEQRLRVRLFHRTTRRQSLTDDGQAYYERCVRAIAELDAGEAALDAGRREPSGRLRVSAPVQFGRHCVMPIVQRLAQKYPTMAIEMSFSDRVLDLVDEGYDLAIRVGPLPDSSSLAARRLGTQRMCICASPSYLAQHGRPNEVHELSNHTGVVYGREGNQRLWTIRDRDGRVHDVRISSRLNLDDLQAIADAAVAGIGLAWLPCWLLTRSVRAGQLELVMDSDRVLSTEIHAVWPKARHLPAKTRVAIDMLVEEIPALLGQ